MKLSINQSINQSIKVLFLSVTQQIIILKYTHVVEKKESATKRYTLKHAPIQGYKSNYLKMHDDYDDDDDILFMLSNIIKHMQCIVL